MEKLAKQLASNIAKSLGYDEEKEQVIAYGLTAMIQTAGTVLLVLILGLIIGTPIEALIICFSVSLLRKYSGGAHVSFIELCTSLGVIYCVIISFISKNFLVRVVNSYWMAASILVIYVISFIAIYLLAPVDSPNKPIRTLKKKKRMRRGSYITLSVYLTLSVIFLLLSFKNHNINSFGISLLFGVIWQIFTLTKFGSYFLCKIDHLVRKIFLFRKTAMKN